MKAIKDNAFYSENISKQDDGFKASATLDLSVVPADGDTITLDGIVFTYKDSPSDDDDVQTADTAEVSIDNLIGNANLPNTTTYIREGTNLIIEYNTIGTAGNDYTLDCSYTSVPSSLSGGSDTPDTDWIKASNTTLICRPIQANLHSDTSDTNLVIYNCNDCRGIADNDSFMIVDTNNITEDVIVNNVTTDSIDVVSSSDTFGDGSLIAKYLFDNNANDVLGNHNGTWTGTETYDTGKFDQAVSFSGGTGDYIDIDSISGKKCISLWTNVTDATNGSIAVGTKVNNEGWNYISAYGNDGNFLCDTLGRDDNNADNIVFYSDNVSINTGEWYHFVFVLDGTPKGKWYINGIEIENETTKDFSNQSTFYDDFVTRISSTGSSDAGNYAINGLVDQIEIYNRPLNKEEVKILYNQQLIKYSADINASITPTKAFFNDPIDVNIDIESTSERVINEPNNYLIIDDSTASDGSNIVTNVKLVENNTIVVDGVEALGGSVSYDSDSGLYTQDLPNHSLATKPKRAYLKGGVYLIKDSSTTTEFVGISINKSGLLTIGDVVELDGIEVSSTNMVEEAGLISSVNPFNEDTSSLVAKYELNGDINDTCGNYNGIDISNSITFKTGKFDDCAKFTGDTNEHIDFSPIDISSKTFTISTWIKRDSSGSSASVGIVQQNNTAYTNELSIVPSTGVVYIGDGNSYDGIDTNWNHLVAVYRTDGCDLYVNNEKKLDNVSVDTNYDDLYSLGNRRQYNTNYIFKGYIDQVEIYDKALTEDEVSILYNQYTSKYSIEFDELSSAPETCKIPNRDKVLEVGSKTFDGTNFSYTHEDYEKQGRAFQRSITASKADIQLIEPMQTTMWKEG